VTFTGCGWCPPMGWIFLTFAGPEYHDVRWRRAQRLKAGFRRPLLWGDQHLDWLAPAGPRTLQPTATVILKEKKKRVPSGCAWQFGESSVCPHCWPGRGGGASGGGPGQTNTAAHLHQEPLRTWRAGGHGYCWRAPDTVIVARRPELRISRVNRVFGRTLVRAAGLLSLGNCPRRPFRSRVPAAYAVRLNSVNPSTWTASVILKSAQMPDPCVFSPAVQVSPSRLRGEWPDLSWTPQSPP